ncbi:ras and EF-hand domain-containing protein homolog isoform X2 [Colossoma macropomum]|uniref:ras and EF-hand domain-containing protein homolog isoform X2 n=1 Tax=Colossoma macropomum TaxID=42526 RepID=UPI001863EF07|nr:ras and EF-hand domain-containing protein homolog isoform X2 [Colossoma macropomum]
MSEFPHSQTMNVVCKSSDDEESQAQPELQPRKDERKESGLASAAVLEKTQEFFQICDSESKGYITRTDMRKLYRELPLSSEELENVFDSLDSDRNGYLTQTEFSSGFSNFLHGRRMSEVEDQVIGFLQKVPEALYQDEPQAEKEDDEEKHFSMLMESLGASNVFEDPSEVRELWAQLRKDEPHLLYNFEEFLARVTSQIRAVQQERREMESALRKKAATHDSEIQRLYEEMEQQMKNEKDRLLLKDSERLQLRSQDLQQQLSSKEQELEQLFLKQRRLEHQCRELHSEQQESRVENIKLKMTNEELSRELEHTCHELSLAQEQLAFLQEKASRLQQEREMEMYRITEGLQREKQSLMKQLDLLREMNKHLRDERDVSSLKQSNSWKKLSHKQRPASTLIKHSDKKNTQSEVGTEELTQHSNKKTSTMVNGCGPHLTYEAQQTADGCSMSGSPGLDVLDDPPEGWPLRRVISIEEDHLPHLLQGEPQPLLHQLASAHSPPPAQVKPFLKQKGGRAGVPSSARGQPVGKETLQKGPVESAVAAPERLFKVVLVGNSSVGKTALLRRFCDGHFHSATTATVGIDYSVRTLNLGDSHVALQLWDTAGQERYRSITKQFFRKADGVVVIYDVTMHSSFRSVRPWLASIQEAVGDPIPIMLLGNKSDKESMREVPAKEGKRLAEETGLMFFECSACTGCNVLEAMLHLARVLREQEDRVWESTVRLVDQPVKKKSCCK